jgi:hypothetical protein
MSESSQLFQTELAHCGYEVRYFSSKYPIFNPDAELGAYTITSWVRGFEIEDSMDYSFRIGKLYVNFALGMQKIVQFTGNDFIIIKYASNFEFSKANVSSKNIIFRVLNITEEVPASLENNNEKYKVQTLCFSLAEAPYYDILLKKSYFKTFPWNDDSLLSSGYSGISSIVRETIQDVLNKEGLDIELNIEETDDTLTPEKNINFYNPSWPLLKSINYLKRFASSLVGGNSYYNFSCKDGRIDFISIDSLYNSKINDLAKTVYISRDYDEKYDSKVKLVNSTNQILHHKYDWYNGTDLAFNGLGGQTVFSKDYKSSHNFVSHDFKLFKKQETPKDAYWLHSQDHGDQWSDISYSPLHLPHLIQNLKRYEFSKKAFNSVKVDIICYVSSQRNVGDISTLCIPSEKGIIDPNFGNNLLLWKIVDKVGLGDSSYSILTFKKNSFTGANGGNFGELINIL